MDKSKLFNILLKNRLFLSLWIFFVFLFLLFTIFYNWNFRIIYQNVFSNFEIIDANFDLNIKKVPFNTKSIDIIFSKNLDKSTIIKDNFSISPYVKWTLELKDNNTISYKLEENLKIWFDYVITIKKNIKSTSHNNLDKDITYIIKAWEESQVIKFIPDKNLLNLNNNIWVFFSNPMVNLTTIDNKNDQDCPINIIPKVEWKCYWTTNSILEFEPLNGFLWATKYEVTINNSKDFNYPLSKEFKTTFSTQELIPNLENWELKVSPKHWIILNFNFPVEVSELKKYLLLNWKVALVEQNNLSDVSFIVKPSNWNLLYDTDYNVLIKSWLKPKYGNIPLKWDFNIWVRTNSFLSYFTIYKNQYSQTWALIDTIMMREDNKLPLSNWFIRLKFDYEINLDKNLFSLTNKDWKKIDFKLDYVKTDNNWDITENKDLVDLTLLTKLSPWSEFSLKFLSKIDKSLYKDLEYSFVTPEKLKIYDLKIVDYSKLCLYTNNYLDEKTILKSIKLPKNNKLVWFNFWNYIDDYDFKYDIEKLSFENKNKELIKKWFCPLPVENQVMYSLDTRLIPNTLLNLSFDNLSDLYWNTLEQIFVKSIKTWILKDKDKYIYNSFNNFTNVVPWNLPININFKTVNLDKINIEVCELSPNNYFSYLKNYYQENNEPLCLSKTQKEINVKNLNWKLSNTFISLEKDILNKPLKTNWVYLIKTYAWKINKNNLKTTNIAIKTNISLFLEKWTNKSLIFASDITTWKILGDLKFEIYDHNLNLVNKKVIFNKLKWVYEVDWDLNFMYIKGSNNKDYWLLLDDDFFTNYDFKYIAGQSSEQKYFSYVYSDRPIYKQWDEVLIKWFFRKFDFDWYKKSDISKVRLNIISDNLWESFNKIDLKLDENWNFNTSFIIPKDSQLWNFTFQLEDVSKNKICSDFEIENWIDCNYWTYIYTYWNFSIEQYKKPTFKLDLSIDDKDKKFWDTITIKTQPKYYFWGKVSNTKWNYTVLSQNYFFDPKYYLDYTFWTNKDSFDCLYWGYCNYSDKALKSDEFLIDSEWKYVLNYKIPNLEEEELWEKIFTFNFEITDPYTNKKVVDTVSKVIHLTDGYVWIKSNYYNSLKDGIKLDLITLNHDWIILKNKNVKIDILKRDWEKTKILWVDWTFYNDYSLKTTNVLSQGLSTDINWEKTFNYQPKQWGEYELIATYVWEDKKVFKSSTIVYVEGENNVNWRNDNNTVTEVLSEKSVLKLWDTAKFYVKSPVNNWKILLVVEKDDWIIDYFVDELKSFTYEFNYKITDKHYPNIYLKVFLIWNDKNNQIPIFKRWLWTVKVLSDYKKLNVEVIPTKNNYKPWEKLNIEFRVKDINNRWVKNANLSVSIVDQSVLALKWNPKKNPYAFFYEMRRYLWTLSYWNLKYLIEKLEIKDTSWWEKWWSWDQKWWETKKARWNFKDTAYWLADLKTDNNWLAKVSVDKLPDNLTTWVIEAVVNTQDNKFWVWYSEILTTKKLLIQENLPSFISTWDKILFTPTIFNKTWVDQEFEIKFITNKWNLKTNTKKIFIKSQDAKNVDFEFNNSRDDSFNNWDLLNITIEARWIKSNDIDKINKNILINDSYIKQTTVTSWFTKDLNVDEVINLKWLENKNWNLEINVSPTLFKNNILTLPNFRDYWYNSLSDKNFNIFNIAIVKSIWKEFSIDFNLKKKYIEYLSEENSNYKKITLEEYIKSYLSSLNSYRQKDWWFWFFVEDKKSNYLLTLDVYKNLNYLKNIWFDINKELINWSKTYLKNSIYLEKTCENEYYYNKWCINKSDKIKAMIVLLDFDKTLTDLFDLYQIYDLEDEISIENLELVFKLSKLKKLNDDNKKILEAISKKIVNNMVDNNIVILPRWAFLSLKNWSRLNNTLKFLELNSSNNFDYMKNSNLIINNMIKFVNFNNSFNDIKTLESLLILVKNYNEIKKSNFNYNVVLNSKTLSKWEFKVWNIFDIYNKKILIKDLNELNNITFSKLWIGNLYYDLVLNYFVPSYESKNIDSWYYIEKKYFYFDDYKKIKELKQKEFDKYMEWKITYDDLKYKKNIEFYLTEIKNYKVWDLVVVYNKIIAKNPSKNIEFESYIPSWSEIVNFNLSTENKLNNILENDFEFDSFKVLDNKIYWIKSDYDAWFYNYSYLLRLTHAWEFNLKPTTITDYDFRENFGSTSGIKFIITK